MDNHSLRSTLSTGISWDEMSSLKGVFVAEIEARHPVIGPPDIDRRMRRRPVRAMELRLSTGRGRDPGSDRGDGSRTVDS